jgi:hypothetical protein
MKFLNNGDHASAQLTLASAVIGMYGPARGRKFVSLSFMSEASKIALTSMLQL